MSRKSPAFSFYPDSWFGGTLLMNAEQKAAYIDLLCAQWVNGGSLTKEQAYLVCRGVSTAAVDYVLSQKFECDAAGLYCNPRLEQERNKQVARKVAGSRGGQQKQVNKLEHEKQIAKQANSKPASKEVSKPPSKNLHSDSVSDSVSDSGSVPSSDSKIETSSLSTESTVSVQEFFDRWNRFAEKTPKIKPCRKLTPKRRQKIAVRLKESGWFGDFREAVVALPLGGDGWQPTLDWLIENGHNAYRILEGDFDWRSKDDPAAIRLAEQRRKNAYQERLEIEKCQKQQIKSNINGLHRAIENILPVKNGGDEASLDESLLFGGEGSLCVSGANHSVQ